MKVSDYKCDICKEKVENIDVLIGLAFNENKCEYKPEPIESAENHICENCLDDLAKFRDKWKKLEEMTPVERYSWENDLEQAG